MLSFNHFYTLFIRYDARLSYFPLKLVKRYVVVVLFEYMVYLLLGLLYVEAMDKQMTVAFGVGHQRWEVAVVCCC